MSSSKSMLWLCLSLAGVLLISGCSGCKQDPLVDRDKKKLEEEKKKKKPKEDFVFKQARTVPADDTVAAPVVKPGHWITVAHEIKANNRDFNAELHTMVTDNNERPYFVQYTPFKLASSRPAKLPKGQDMRFETIYFIPEVAAGDDETVGLHRELRAARGSALLKNDWQPVIDMPGYQYFFMVLSSNAQRYTYLKAMTSIAPPTSDPENYDRVSYLHYRVLLPKLGRFAPLPSNPLTWTGIAYILWDDANPGMLTNDQQAAMLDWVHWGGQLIISGPNSLENLKGTFLEEYLPATFVKSTEVDQAAIDEINAHWSLKNRKTNGKRTLNVLPGKPLVGIQLEKHPAADFLPHTGQLVAERRVGAGRIVTTAFSLTDRAIVRWPSYDSFFNGCLLRRPPREFRLHNLMMDAKWVNWDRVFATDARLTTTLRYFSRDISYLASDVQNRTTSAPVPTTRDATIGQPAPLGSVADEQREIISQDLRDPAGDDDDWHFMGYRRATQGMAGWNDQSGASHASREALRVAAGISIPKGDFVLKVLAIYLIVLAPVNWGIFRMIGRVEWAWVAAPALAIIGAVVVIRLAQLDIGFARSVTEIAVAEVQGEHPRAHLTRYSAMYTSLAKSYDLVFDDEVALASPFGADTNFQRTIHDSTYTVSLRRDRNLKLSGFQVKSNKTGTVHTEQMADIGGSFQLLGDSEAGLQLNNTTPLSLNDVGVLRRTESGALQVAWVGELPAASARPLKFAAPDAGVARLAQWDESSATRSFDRQADAILGQYDRNRDKKLQASEVAGHAEIVTSFARFDVPLPGNNKGDEVWTREELLTWCRESRFGEVSVGRLVDLASQGIKLGRGDVRMIGWTDEELPGMKIHPAAAQETRRTMFLVHLRRGTLPEPVPDENCVLDFKEERPITNSDTLQEERTTSEESKAKSAPAQDASQ